MTSDTRTEPSTAASILDEIYEENTSRAEQLRGCSIGLVLKDLSEADREGLKRAFADRNVRGPVIAEILKRRGYSVSERTVQRHRSGSCSCG